MDFTMKQLNTIRQIVHDEIHLAKYTGPESVTVRNVDELRDSLRKAEESLERGEGIPGDVVFAELESRQAARRGDA